MNHLLKYHPPYRWDQVLGFLSGRTIDGVELIQDGSYARTVRLVGADGTVSVGWLRVSHREDKNALELEISDGLSPVGKEVVKRVRRQFDLDQNPDEIHEQLKTLGQIREGLPVLGTRIPGAFEPFEMAVRAILGQQITVTFARSLADRLTATYGTPVDTGQPGLTYIFPTPEKIASLSDGIEDHLGKLGVLSARSRTIASACIYLKISSCVPVLRRIAIPSTDCQTSNQSPEFAI